MSIYVCPICDAEVRGDEMFEPDDYDGSMGVIVECPECSSLTDPHTWSLLGEIETGGD